MKRIALGFLFCVGVIGSVATSGPFLPANNDEASATAPLTLLAAAPERDVLVVVTYREALDGGQLLVGAEKDTGTAPAGNVLYTLLDDDGEVLDELGPAPPSSEIAVAAPLAKCPGVCTLRTTLRLLRVDTDTEDLVVDVIASAGVVGPPDSGPRIDSIVIEVAEGEGEGEEGEGEQDL